MAMLGSSVREYSFPSRKHPAAPPGTYNACLFAKESDDPGIDSVTRDGMTNSAFVICVLLVDKTFTNLHLEVLVIYVQHYPGAQVSCLYDLQGVLGLDFCSIILTKRGLPLPRYLQQAPGEPHRRCPSCRRCVPAGTALADPDLIVLHSSLFSSSKAPLLDCCIPA